MRIRKDTFDTETDQLKVDTYWSRINLEQDPATGLIKGEPQVEPWLRKAERPERQSLREDALPVPGLQLPASLQGASHPGHRQFVLARDAVHRMEFAHQIPPGPHSDQLAAALACKAEQEGLRLDAVKLRLEAQGRIDIIERAGYDVPERHVPLDSREALARSVEAHSRDWAAARSPHYVSQSPAAERTGEHLQALAQLPTQERALFDRIRDRVPAHIGDDHVLQAMVEGRRQAWIDGPDRLGGVEIRGDRLSLVDSSAARFRATIDLSAPAPTLHESLEQNDRLDQQLAQQRATAESQREQQGPVMRMG